MDVAFVVPQSSYWSMSSGTVASLLKELHGQQTLVFALQTAQHHSSSMHMLRLLRNAYASCMTTCVVLFMYKKKDAS
jgi:hypothetical protein